MKEITLKIANNGDLFLIHDDDMQEIISDLGNASLIRASNVLWDEEKQSWFIYPANRIKGYMAVNKDKTIGNPYGYKLRKDAVKDEIRIFSEGLASGQLIPNTFFSD